MYLDILYIDTNTTKGSDEIIDTFEAAIKEYEPNNSEPIAPSRKLIQLGFKDHIDEKFFIG